MKPFALIAALAATSVVATSASAINIVLDYTHDAGGYFLGNATARATVEKAASDISTYITTNLNAVTTSNVGTDGAVAMTFTHSIQYTNPSTNATMTIPAVVPADDVRIYVGRQSLASPTLGQGGPAAPAASIGGGGSGSITNYQNAVAAGAAASNVNLTRGGGPIIGSLSRNVDLRDGGGNVVASIPFSYDYGVLAGNLWFDVDPNNGATAFNDYFQIDHTQPVGSKIDLYTVALHEMLHAVGIGLGTSWDSNVSGNDWTGANVISLLGVDNNAVAPGHINAGVGQSVVAGTNISQLPVMLPSLAPGQRRFLTDLDVAFLRDIGWTVAVPEPTYVVAFAAFSVLLRRRRVAA